MLEHIHKSGLVTRIVFRKIPSVVGGTLTLTVRGISTVFLNVLFLDTHALHVEGDGDENARSKGKKAKPPAPPPKPDVPATGANAAEPEGSDSDESDDSV